MRRKLSRPSRILYVRRSLIKHREQIGSRLVSGTARAVRYATNNGMRLGSITSSES